MNRYYKKKSWILSIIFISSLIVAKEVDAFAVDSKGTIGTVTINGEVYNQVSFRPEIPFGKIALGLDIYFYFNNDGILLDSWNFSTIESSYRTVIDKVYYLRWGKPSDNIYFMIGALPSTILGTGILINNYSNVVEYPQSRKIGLDFKYKLKKIGFEFIHSNLKVTTPGIIGSRAYIDLSAKISAGISYVVDLNQNSGLKDRDGDSYPDYYDYYPDDSDKYDDYDYWKNIYFEIKGDTYSENDFINWYKASDGYNHYDPNNQKNDPVSGWSFDFTFDFSRNTKFYSQLAYLLGEIDTNMIDKQVSLESSKLGWGFVPAGVKTNLGPINVITEYRINSRRFVFNYWDRSYDINRVTLNSSGSIITKESSLYRYGKLSGFYAQAQMNFFKTLNISIGYQNMNGEILDTTNTILKYKKGQSNQTLLMAVGINPSLIPKVKSANAFYQQSNVPNPFSFISNLSTIWGYKISLELSKGVILLYKAQTNYIMGLNGSIDPIESINIETQFTL